MTRRGRGAFRTARGALALLLAAGRAEAAKPNIMESCKVCHTAADGVVRGKLVSVAGEFKSLSLTVGPLVWIVKYGDDLKVKEGDKRHPAVVASDSSARSILAHWTDEFGNFRILGVAGGPVTVIAVDPETGERTSAAVDLDPASSVWLTLFVGPPRGE